METAAVPDDSVGSAVYFIYTYTEKTHFVENTCFVFILCCSNVLSNIIKYTKRIPAVPRLSYLVT